MVILKPDKLRYAQCPYCYTGRVGRDSSGEFACIVCGHLVLIKGEETRVMSTSEIELTSMQLLDNKNDPRLR